MSISIYMKGGYEEFHALRRRKNKPNSKPNKANLRHFVDLVFIRVNSWLV